ncbi:MAG: hypothetical protein LBC10_01370 [Deltaproteobacteria bacterium]|jgi:hypothetical protein|nr:hypothetical protein [Deltaproteobacteria bacterium]
MTQPPGSYDPIRRALEYLQEALAERKAQGLPPDGERLLDEAGMRFNLSPNEARSLARLFREHDAHGNDARGA